MATTDKTRFRILFDAWYRLLSSALLLPPSASYVEIEGDQVHVRMGWAFRASFPLSAVASVAEIQKRPFSRGVHGIAGRWLVNGSGQGILAIDLAPPQRAHVVGFPVSLRQLLVSMEDPSALAKALAPRG